MTYRGRFAPSPTGRLHFGSLVAALGSWLRARSEGGAWLVRIEDVDHVREVAGAREDILATLDAFGLVPDEPVIRQSGRDALYEEALAQLVSQDLAYACWCSRSDLMPFAGMHPRHCVAAPIPERTPAWRVRVPDETVCLDDQVRGRFCQSMRDEIGDFVVRRVDGAYSYQLAVVVDDSAQRISEVVRGADLLDSTPRQMLLQRMLKLPTPAYLHLPLALDAQGRKLSKHEQARTVDAGDPIPALRLAAAFLGQPVPPATSIDRFLRTAIDDFDISRIPRSTCGDAALRKD